MVERTPATGPTVGIDFGTSTTLVATRPRGLDADTVPIGRTTPWLPSVVGIASDGELVVGEDTDRLPRRDVVRSAKSAITSGQDHVVLPGGREVELERAVGAILGEALTRAAERGVELGPAVQLGCPAMWRMAERRLLLDLAAANGLELGFGQLIDEPIAAGVAWVEQRILTGVSLPDTKILVFDPGGGTLDIAVLKTRSDGGEHEITVLAADGRNEAGDVLDRAVADDLAATVAGLDVDDPVQQAMLLDAARILKERLTDVASFTQPLGGESTLVLQYDRARLVEAFEPQWRRARSLAESVARAARIRDQDGLTTSAIRQLPWDEVAQEIGVVLLVGGLSRMPILRTRMQELFPEADVLVLDRPQEAVVRGLAFSERYQRLNLHRPPFDFYVSFYDKSRKQLGDEVLVYPAFTPLYKQGEPLTQHVLRYQPAAMPVSPRNAVSAVLHARTVEGDDMVLDLGGESYTGLPVPIAGGLEVNFTLYVTGDVAFGKGQKLRVRSWPTLRGSRFNWLEFYAPHEETSPFLEIDEWRFNH